MTEQDEAWVREIAEMPDGEFAVHTMRDVLAALDEARQALAAAEAREAALRATLAFYADPKRYDQSEQCGSEACLDAGQHARFVLAATETDEAAASARGGGEA